MSSSSTYGYVVLSTATSNVFPNSSKNDLLVYTSSNQSILVGQSNSSNYLRVSSNLVQVIGNLDFSGALTQNGTPFVSGGGFSGSSIQIAGPLECRSISINANSSNAVSSGGSGSSSSSSGPSNKLTVYTSSSNSNAFSGVSSNAAGTGVTLGLAASNTFFNVGAFGPTGSNITEVLRVTGTGFVGIGTTAPQYSLDVAGSVRYTTLVGSSDSRVKSNIQNVDEAWASSVIAALEPVTFSFNTSSTSSSTSTGFIAQDVATVFPSATRTSTDFVPLVGSATIDGTTMTCDLPLVPNDIFRTADGTVCTVEQVTSSNTFEISGATKTTGTLDIAEILVDDFKSIDFNAILAAAVASIKSLTKRVAVLEAASKL
jgi:hypothetical protein